MHVAVNNMLIESSLLLKVGCPQLISGNIINYCTNNVHVHFSLLVAEKSTPKLEEDVCASA